MPFSGLTATSFWNFVPNEDVEIILEDTELGLPLEGAVIRSWDGKQYICDQHGKTLISVPDDRRVVVQAAYPGMKAAD